MPWAALRLDIPGRRMRPKPKSMAPTTFGALSSPSRTSGPNNSCIAVDQRRWPQLAAACGPARSIRPAAGTSIQNIPIKAKRPISTTKVAAIIATVRNTSPTGRGVMARLARCEAPKPTSQLPARGSVSVPSRLGPPFIRRLIVPAAASERARPRRRGAGRQG